ncbi:MAG TPA: CpaD family pilus assembly lipoprotein [Alphaproteobacteria bacterium]
MRLSLLLISVLALGACSPEKPWLMKPTNTIEGKMRLIESRHVVKKPLAEYSDDDLANAAYTYRRNGAGPVYIAIAYDDTIGKGIDHDTAARAQELAVGLVNHGVTEKIIVSTVQMDAPIPVAVIAFDTLTAAAPADCDNRPTVDQAVLAGNDGEDGYNYKIGCGVKGLMALQIAHPADLEGHAEMSPAEAERLTNIISTDYRTGVPNEAIPSYILSELAGKGS